MTATAPSVDIPDPNLRAVIEKELGKTSGDTIRADDMATLTQLAARNVDIRVSNRLEAATNLTELLLGFKSNSRDLTSEGMNQPDRTVS